jgi:hypothetical protein
MPKPNPPRHLSTLHIRGWPNFQALLWRDGPGIRIGRTERHSPKLVADDLWMVPGGKHWGSHRPGRISWNFSIAVLDKDLCRMTILAF